MLVADIGYTETSKRTGILRDTLYKWGQRKGWNEPIQHAQEARVQSVQSPADAHAAVIQANGAATKLGLSTYARRQAEQLAENGKLKDHHAFKNVTSGASQLHGWEAKEQAPGVMVNVAILGIDPASVRISDSEHE